MRIVLAIGHFNPRLAMEMLLSEQPDICIVGTTGDSQSLQAMIPASQPDLVVLDWGLPGRPTPEDLLQAQERPGQPRYVVLGQNPILKQQILAAGAEAFVAVGDPPEKLLAALRRE